MMYILSQNFTVNSNTSLSSGQMMDLIIELKDSEGNEGTRHRLEEIKISNDATVEQLKQRLEPLFHIAQDYQHLFFRNTRLIGLSKKLREFGMENESTIVLKHSMIDMWSDIVKRPFKISLADIDDQPNGAQHTLNMINILAENKVFLCYPRLFDEMERISAEVREYFGGCKTTMEAATRSYFFGWLKEQKILKDPQTFAVSFGPKVGGIHPGCVATICYDGVTEVFHIKTHHAGPTRSSSKSALPLEIGIGPECHFYGPLPGKSSTTIYIATKSIPNLILMDGATENSPNIRNILLEIHAATSLLCLGDVNERNCGYHDEKSSIFDFSVPEGDYTISIDDYRTHKPQCVDTLTNVREVGKMSAFAQTITADERMKAGKCLVQKWQMLERMDAAVKEVLLVKERIRSNGGVIENTGDLNNYVVAVKHNISLLAE